MCRRIYVKPPAHADGGKAAGVSQLIRIDDTHNCWYQRYHHLARWMALASGDNPPDCGGYRARRERRPCMRVAFTPFADVVEEYQQRYRRSGRRRDGAFWAQQRLDCRRGVSCRAVARDGPASADILRN